MLTIVIPSYNHSKYIRECLLSISYIKEFDFKVLVIDDGSLDDTNVIVQKFIEDFSYLNIEFITKSKNKGLVDSLNLAIGIADTKYIYMCASDDVPIASGVEACVLSLEENLAADFVIGNAKGFDGSGRIFNIYNDSHLRFFKLNPAVRWRKLFFSYPRPLLIQSTIFRLSTLRNIGGWDSDVRLDDFSLFVKLFKKEILYGDNFLFLDNVFVVNYRQHEANAYRDLHNLFSMTNEVVYKYADESDKSKIVSSYAAQYLISALYNGNFVCANKIVKSIGLRSVLMLPYYFAKEISRRIVNAFAW